MDSDYNLYSKHFEEKNKKMHEEESSFYGWVGLTNVELATKIYSDIESALINPDEKEAIIHQIALSLREFRTY